MNRLRNLSRLFKDAFNSWLNDKVPQLARRCTEMERAGQGMSPEDSGKSRQGTK